MSETGTRRSLGAPAADAAVVTVALLIGLVIAAAAAAMSGATAPTLLQDPGPAVRWGLVAVRVVADISAALTVGTLVLAAVALPIRQERVHRPALLLAAGAATAWALAQLVLLVLTLAETLGTPPGGERFGAQLVSFARDVSFGQALASTMVAAAVIGLLAAGAITPRATGLLALASLAALVPTALSGHSSASTDHETAVTSLGLHLVGVSVWVGGLVALLLLSPGLETAGLRPAVHRYSTLAGWAFGAVALSGFINAWPRLGGWAGLNTDYGLLVIGKTATLVLLAAAGYWHRQRTLPELDAGRRHAFAQLAGVEVIVMAVAIGLAAALSRTPPPAVGDPTVDLAQSITGYPMPEAPTLGRWLTAWQPDLLWELVVALAGVGYVTAVAQLRARGDRWPVLRTVSFLAGLLLLLYVTSGAPAVYGRVLFSGHMVMHMLLSMVVPPLLVLGAPILLALRVLPARGDGSRGAREWILAVLGSRFTRVLAFAPVAAVLFAGSLVVFYYTDLFELALTTHAGHELMQVHFLLAGYLFAWVLIGIDPGPNRASHPLRLIVLFATIAFHGFFFLAVMNATTVLQAGYFDALARPWGRDLLADQQYGGGIGWAVGEIPAVLFALVVAVQWARSDDRNARRQDRAADRDGDAELAEYNAMLARLAGRRE